MKSQLLNEAENMQEELVSWRRTLHQIPEIGLKLPQTVEFVKTKLDGMGITYKVHEDCSCITAEIGEGGKCFMLRSDMDGLPMKEMSGETFASKNNCMHACGHDMHTAILLGAAKLLKEHEKELKGTVKLLFQSGEETFEGALAAIDAGVMENPHVDASFAMHVASIVPNNMIFYGSYPMSSVYGFKITLTGKGAHGSTPELGIDPIIAGSHICIGLQELIAREISATQEGTLTIGHFEAGSASNIIPETAVLEGTLRTFKPEIREFLIQRIREVVDSIATAYRTKVEWEVLSDVPAVKCDENMNKEIIESIRGLNDEVKMFPLYHVMGSEDFAFFSEKIPSSYWGLGAGVDEGEKVGQHNPRVRFNEKCLSLGTAVYVKTAMDWLEAHKE